VKDLIGREGEVIVTVSGTTSVAGGLPRAARTTHAQTDDESGNQNARWLAEALRAVLAGDRVIPIATRISLERIGEAHALAQKGPGGKIVLLVGNRSAGQQ
jgi:hypothetical protein